MKLRPDPNGLLTMVFLVVKHEDDHLLIRRDPYLGLPGESITEEEDILHFARRVLFQYVSFQPRAMTYETAHYELISEFIYPWGQSQVMARCQIYEFPIQLQNHFGNGKSFLTNIRRLRQTEPDITVKRYLAPQMCAA